MAPRKAFLLRINQALHSEIEAWAEDEFRSVNAQIEFLLREAVRRRRKQATAEDAAEPNERSESSPEA